MQDIVNLLTNPLLYKVLFSYWVFSAIVGAMPTPTENSNPGYVFLFRFLHALGGNLNRAAVALKVPGGAPEDAK